MANFIRLLVENILRNPKEFQWTVQGLGMMRLYLSQEVRLHIWDSSLKIPGVSPIHDHPWDLESTIVVGKMKQHRYTVPTYREQVTETFKYAKIKCGEEACTMEEPKEIELVENLLEVYPEGQVYRQKKDEIHISLPEDGTVTLVKRTFHEDRDHALVFWRGKGGWVDAVPRNAKISEVEEVCNRSLQTWF